MPEENAQRTKPCTVLRQKCHKVPRPMEYDGSSVITLKHSEAKVLARYRMYLNRFLHTDLHRADTSGNEPL